MHPGVKLVFTLVFIIFLNLTPAQAWPAYIFFYTFLLALVLVSRIQLSILFQRTLLATPFILAAIPLIFSANPPYYSISLLPDVEIYLSLEGLQKFVSIAIKFFISIQAAILLTATTRFPDLLFAMERLKVPKLMVAIIGLAWRFLFVIRDVVLRMIRARTSRSSSLSSSSHSGGSLWWRARVTGVMAGSLFLRSIECSDRIYAAMLSRGYVGVPLPSFSKTISINRNEFLGLGFGIFLIVMIWIFGLFTGG